MGLPDEDKMDSSSIKPVSSLLSHFENMSSTRLPARSPSTSDTVSMPSQANSVIATLPLIGRASHKLSRRNPAWSTPERTRDSIETDTVFHVSNRPTSPKTRVNSTIRTRPTSMGPSSPSRFFPTMEIDPPRSPPRSFAIPKVYLAANTLSPTPVGTDLQTSSTLPLNHLQPSSPQIDGNETRHSISLGRSVPVEPKHLQRPYNSDERIMSNQSKSIPPPVNRAEKPEIYTKAERSDKNTRPSLEPEETRILGKVSPFSTPPSNDESPSQADTVYQYSSSLGQPNKTQHSQADGYFFPHSLHHNSKPFPSVPAVGRAKKFNTTTNPSTPVSNVSERQPDLPPRRDSVVGSYDSRHSPAMAVDSTRVSRKIPIPSQPFSQRNPSPNEAMRSSSEFLPPPKRNTPSNTVSISGAEVKGPIKRSLSPLRGPSSDHRSSIPSQSSSRNTTVQDTQASSMGIEITSSPLMEYPDASRSNRRPPHVQSGVREIETNYDTRLFDISGQHVCTTGFLTRAWDLSSGEMVMSLSHGEKEIKVTAIAFKAGAKTEEEGIRLWLGTNYGDLQEIDLSIQNVVYTRSNAHSKREIVRIIRHQNAMWTLDDDGHIQIWLPDENGLPNLGNSPISHRVPKGHTFSIVIKDLLWLATGREIRIFRPGSRDDSSFYVTQRPLHQATTSDITSGAVISNQLDRVYFGHTDGKISIYSTDDYSCLGLVNVSVYKINSLAGAGSYLWAGYNTGMIYVYDTRERPWALKKDWHAHDNPVANIITDRSSVWKLGHLQIASIGTDNAIRIWDGMLEEDWLENDMQEHDLEYCEHHEIKAVVITWNAGATTPSNLRYDEKDNNFFREVIQVADPPDLLVFGFQELVDLEDKKLTAKSFFKGNKKKDSFEQEHMSRQYRTWRDYLIRCIEEYMPTHEPYHLLHTASMVGLFSCVFIKASARAHIRNLHATEIKRGMGGLHGNKGALILRFVLHDSSICLVNCHLAAGQTQTVHRNNDITAILEAAPLPLERDPSARIDTYIGGGDGSMILDHEICILNGDLNYRIDTMGRDTVIKAINANNLGKLLERDQLLVSRRRNPGFRLRAFDECPITFAPTYKYDVGTDKYDTSEKQRAPAWCDRLLYRGIGRIKQTEYRRHEVRASDHRPVSGTFRMRIKSISPKERLLAWQRCEKRFRAVREQLAIDAKIDYLVSVLGLEQAEAQASISS